MAAEHTLVFDGDSVRFVYHDALAGLLDDLQEVRVNRASHVEPALEGGWTADMSPVGGPVLTAENGRPFRLRAEALRAEVEWLADHGY